MKNNQPTYGYKLHIGVDEISGLIRKAEMTPAGVHDSRIFDPLLSGDERAVHADKAYDDTARRERLQKKGINDGILKKGRRNTPLTDWEPSCCNGNSSKTWPTAKTDSMTGGMSTT